MKLLLKMENKEKNLEFKISQLRQDKIIYAVEACAINLICLFMFFFSNQYFSGTFKNVINIISLIIALVYMLYMIVGNIFRFKKILIFQKKL